MKLITIAISIAAPPERVFTVLINTDTYKSWNTGLVSISPIKQLDQGDAYETVSTIMGKEIASTNMTSTVIPNELLVQESLSGPLKYLLTYRLKPKDDGTIIVCDYDIQGENNVLRLARPVLEEIARTRIQHNLNNLKLVIEHGIDNH